MRKVVALFTVLALIFCFAGCGDSADVGSVTPDGEYPEVTSPESDFECTVEGDEVLVAYKGSDENVIVPPVVDGKTVTGIRFCAFQDNITLVSVMIPPTVKSIGILAFSGCTSLTTVYLFNGLENIETEAFAESSVTNIVLPNTIKRIYPSAFYKCTSLKHINIPGSVKKVETNTFQFSGLETVTFENGVEEIERFAFNSTQLKELSCQESMKEISSYAFQDCKNLESVEFNEGLENILVGAFTSNHKLTEVVIPKTVKSVTEFTFDDCSALKKVMFEGDAPEDYTYEAFGDLSAVNVSYTVCYHEGAKGFTSPTWNGYPTEIW